jgi:hypothetical protein
VDSQPGSVCLSASRCRQSNPNTDRLPHSNRNSNTNRDRNSNSKRNTHCNGDADSNNYSGEADTDT